MSAFKIESSEELEVKIPLSKHQKEMLRGLHAPNHLKSILSISLDWALILTAYCLTGYSAYLLPLAMLIIGSRQRALSNLSHDASHINLFNNKKINDLVTNTFCALPLFETVEVYRKSHMKHHQYLGDVEKDPDSRSHLKLGYNDTKPWKGNPFINYLRIISNPRAVASSLIGNLLTLSLKEYFMLTCWWGSAFILLSTIGTLKLALGVVCVWFMSKVTTYHMIRILAEFLDHTGLEQGEVISFSRNLPHNGVLRFIFHPNCDTYHIVHHLYPRIPHYNLAKADFILQSRFDYAQSHQCDSYFFGKHSAASCWVGSCGGTKK